MGKEDTIPRQLKCAGALCLAFANTGVSRRDDRRRDARAPPEMPLEGYQELVRWGQRMGALSGAVGERLLHAAAGRPKEAAAVRASAVELRVAVTRIFTALAGKKEPRAADLAIVNGCLRSRSVVPAGDGFQWQWTDDDDAFERPLWAVARSAAELLVSERHRKVRQCATRGCLRLFIYAHRRRLWCDDTLCGSRQRGRRRQKGLRRTKKRLKAMSGSEKQAHFDRTDRQLDEIAKHRRADAAVEGKAPEGSDRKPPEP